MLKKAQDQNTRLNQAIEELENAIIGADPETDTYTKMVSNLDSLYQLKNGEKPSTVELKDWMPIIGSVSGILVICVFEAFGHSITSKGLAFVSKLKG